MRYLSTLEGEEGIATQFRGMIDGHTSDKKTIAFTLLSCKWLSDLYRKCAPIILLSTTGAIKKVREWTLQYKKNSVKQLISIIDFKSIYVKACKQKKNIFFISLIIFKFLHIKMLVNLKFQRKCEMLKKSKFLRFDVTSRDLLYKVIFQDPDRQNAVCWAEKYPKQKNLMLW